MNQNFIQNSIAAVMPAARATGLFSSLCTIQQRSSTLGETGFPTGSFTSVFDLTDIPCTAPPSSIGPAIVADERKTVDEILASSMLHVLLNDYFPAIEAYWRTGARALIDGTAYDIIGVDNDSQHVQTRLEVRVATV